MEPAMQTRVRDANGQLRTILSQARNVLAGRQDITSETLRNISRPLAEMAPLVFQGAAVRATDAPLDAVLQEYAGNLEDLQNVLEQVRFMLLARQAQLETSRCHLETFQLWATAFKQTR